jgi:hypothetical protein
LSIEIGGETVGARLERAIAAGEVIRRADGMLELAGDFGARSDFHNGGAFAPDCVFLNPFMFGKIYGGKAVPFGCRDCYKVKVTTTSLRDLMEMKTIAEGFACASKSGSEVDRAETPAIYSTYFYLLGLDEARRTHGRLLSEIDSRPGLASAAKMAIKRGCTNYERALGPSDRYSFDPRLASIEAYFARRFVRTRPKAGPTRKHADAMTLLELVQTAYRIGDDTYKDFTGGKDLFPPSVTYDPEAPSASDDDDASPAGDHSISM